jgi:hypothetical protein
MLICIYKIQTALVLRDGASTRLEHLHHFSNSSENFLFNAIWNRRFLATLGLEASIKRRHCTPSVTCMDWLRWWYNHAVHVVSSSKELAFLTSVSDEHTYIRILPSAIQVKNRRTHNQYSREIRRNKLIWKSWMNCWYSVINPIYLRKINYSSTKR